MKIHDIVQATVRVTGVQARHILSPLRDAKTCQARNVVMYVARRDALMTFEAIGVALHRDNSTVQHSCGLVEDAICNGDQEDQKAKLTRYWVKEVARRSLALPDSQGERAIRIDSSTSTRCKPHLWAPSVIDMGTMFCRRCGRLFDPSTEPPLKAQTVRGKLLREEIAARGRLPTQ